jgi:hypothetical protein
MLKIEALNNRKKVIQQFFTSLHYEAQDYNETPQLESMERELETTTDTEQFIKRHGLTEVINNFLKPK